MDTTALIAWRPSETENRGRSKVHTGIRNTEEGRRLFPIPGFPTRFSVDSPRSRTQFLSSAPADSEQILIERIPMMPRPAHAPLQNAGLVPTPQYRELIHEGAGAHTGNSNTLCPGFQTPNTRDSEHRTTGIPNTKETRFTGSPYTETPLNPRDLSPFSALTLSSNQIKSINSVVVFFQRVL
jgi:hypothetical protein